MSKSVPQCPSESEWQLLPDHPRLMARAVDWENLSIRIASDPTAAKLHELQLRQADHMLMDPVLEYPLQGRRLITAPSLGRIITLAMIARLSDDPRFTEKALAEMRQLARLPDWNPSHFLDAAMAATSLSLGYDWLFDKMGQEDRELFRAALVDKALKPSFDSKYNGWVSNTNNWNQVCHSGMTLAALAVADLEPDLARKTVQRAIENIPFAAKAYAPEGAYPEGVGYWDYGTSFHVNLIEALRSALGSDFGLADFPGFLASSDYVIQVTGPTGKPFNYSDCRPEDAAHPTLYWFARERNQPGLLTNEIKRCDLDLAEARKGIRTPSPLYALLWWKAMDEKETKPLPLKWFANGVVPVAFQRSAWDDPKACYLAIKGGAAIAPHAHVDGGTFVLEADGVRWAVDTGLQNYHSLESKGVKMWEKTQDSERWTVFRLGPEAHNILRFDNVMPLVDGHAAIVRFQPEGAHPQSTLELSALYLDHVPMVHRNVSLLPDRTFIIEDAWSTGSKEVAVTSQWLTHAEKIEIEDKRVLLYEAGERLEIRVESETDITIVAEDMSEPRASYDEPNPGLKRLVFSTRSMAGTDGGFRMIVRPGSTMV